MKKRDVRRRKRARHNVGGWAARQKAKQARHKSGRKGWKSGNRSIGYKG